MSKRQHIIQDALTRTGIVKQFMTRAPGLLTSMVMAKYSHIMVQQCIGDMCVADVKRSAVHPMYGT